MRALSKKSLQGHRSVVNLTYPYALLYAIRIQFSDSAFVKLNEVLEGLLGRVDYDPLKQDILSGMNMKTWENDEVRVRSFVAMSGLFGASTFLEVTKIPSSAPSKEDLGL